MSGIWADHPHPSSSLTGLWHCNIHGSVCLWQEIMMWNYCLPDFPHHPFPWAFGAEISWNAATTAVLITTVVGPGITNGDRFTKEPVRDAWNQTEACSNPVIKILHWMLILWKKPNDFAACLISKSDEKPKSIQQNGSTLYTMQAAGRKVHQCGGAAGEKKMERVLYYKARHWSQIFALCWVWKLHTAAKCRRLW